MKRSTVERTDKTMKEVEDFAKLGEPLYRMLSTILNALQASSE